MSKDELLFYNNVALFFQINLYQWKINFLIYATVITHSDITFSVFRLVCFLMNSELLYQAVTDWILLYLKRYWNLNLQLKKDDEYLITNNILFVNNTVNWKSSQSYIMKLFESLVDWQANKQITVTISITKAELMTLSQTACEEIYIQ